MASIANITILDGKAAPLSHIFNPTAVTNGTDARFHERLASGIAISYPELSVLVRAVPGFDGMNRVTVSLKVPQMEVLSGADNGYIPAPKVAYFDMAKVEFNLPGRSTVANRKDVRTLIINALQNAIVIDAVENIAPAF